MAHRKSCLKLHSKTFWIMIEKAWFPFVGLWCWLSSVVLCPCFCFCLATARPCSGHNTSLSFIYYLFVCVPAKQCVSNFTFVSSMKSGYFKQNYKDVSFEQWIPTAVEAATAKDQQYFISLWLRKWRRRWRSTIKICGCPSRKRDGNNSDQHQNTRFCYFYPVSLSIACRNRGTDKRKPIAKTTHWKEPWTQDDKMKWKSRFWCIKSFFCWLKINFDLDFEQCIGHNSTSSKANGETRSMALVNNANDLKEFFFGMNGAQIRRQGSRVDVCIWGEKKIEHACNIYDSNNFIEWQSSSDSKTEGSKKNARCICDGKISILLIFIAIISGHFNPWMAA